MKVPDITKMNLYEKREYNIKTNYPEFYEYLICTYPKDIKFSEKLWWYFHKISTYPVCEVCGKRLKFKDGYSGYGKFCSLKCTGQSTDTKKARKQTNLKKYGSENYNNINKIKQTNLKKYGVENVSQSKTIQEKRTSNNLEKWGVTCTLHNKYIQEKVIKTNLDRYGVEYPVSIKTQESINKSKETFKNNFIKSHDNIINYDEEGNCIMKCPHPECNKCKEKHFIIDAGHYNDRMRKYTEICTNLLPYDNYRSKNTSLEIFIKNILDKYNIEYKTNVRNIIAPKELDIYIPSKKIAIECNGLYWHEDKPANYHLNKFKDCKDHGIQLLTIWEDQIVNKPKIVESVLLSKLGLISNKIGARKCIIKEVPIKECNIFLNQNHIQGKTNSTIKLGLYYKDELVSVMTFSKQLKHGSKSQNNIGYWNLSRFCNKLYTNVIGSASKLLNYFINMYHPNNIISFASNDISNGNLYRTLNFNEDNHYTNAYWYINKKTLQRYHRTSFTKDNLKKLGFDIENKTESQIMNNLPFYKIYDSGHIKFEMNFI